MSTEPRKFRMMWRDGVFVPADRIKGYCDETFGEGEVVTFERKEDESVKSRQHYFASIQTAWENLPEGDERFPTPDDLRYWALIRNGFCTKDEIVCETPDQAALVAAFTGRPKGTIIVVRENVVVKYTAETQKEGAMGRERFQNSKNLVLDTIAELIRVKRKRLEENAGRAA